MKQIALLVCVVALFASCAGLPPTDSSQASLVIGSISLDFPGGFFNAGAREITDAVELNVQNVTTKTEFSVYSRSGYFWFPANGSDEYILESCQFSQTVGSNATVLGEQKIGAKIPATPGNILYVGDISFTYTYVADSATSLRVDRPQPDYTVFVGGTSMGPQGTHGAERRDYMYSVTMGRQWNDQALQERIKSIAPGSPWLSRQIVDLKP
jgi:hypothetical protein